MNVEKEIQKENTVRVIRNIEVERLAEILKPFISKKVRKADEQIVKKLLDMVVFDREQKIEPLTEGGFAKINYIGLRAITYSLTLKFSICYSGGDLEPGGKYYCEYKNAEYYIGDIKGGILVKLDDCEPWPLLDAKAERKQYDKVQKLAEEMETESRKLFYGLRK